VNDLTDQVRRSALAIPGSIAEGWGCFRPKEALEHLDISRRSLIRTQYLLLFAHKKNLIKENEFNEFHEGYEEANKMLTGLIKSIKNKPYKLRARP
jgi:four helix bundle protein